MELRPELLPPTLDEALVARLAALADRLDGVRTGQGGDELADFNRLASTELPLVEFQGVYGGDGREVFARSVLYSVLIRPASNVTRAELAELVRRATFCAGPAAPDSHLAYRAVLDANEPSGVASNLIAWPPDYDPATSTWGGGRPVAEYAPTPEQIVNWALDGPPYR